VQIIAGVLAFVNPGQSGSDTQQFAISPRLAPGRELLRI
jgi:hypothetical protein